MCVSISKHLKNYHKKGVFNSSSAQQVNMMSLLQTLAKILQVILREKYIVVIIWSVYSKLENLGCLLHRLHVKKNIYSSLNCTCRCKKSKWIKNQWPRGNPQQTMLIPNLRDQLRHHDHDNDHGNHKDSILMLDIA